tara:strand:- start:2369 stop:3034 length:666 start_codon:yes stop_codon:yes gene_type:complete
MTPVQVYDMFKSYMDEADTTFITTDQVELYLGQAYNDFRQAVCNIDPFIFGTQHLLTATGAKIDLTLANGTPAATLSGAGATPGKKLERLLRLARIDTIAGNNVIRYLPGAPSERTLPFDGYTLNNTTIIFGGNAAGTQAFRIEYVPYHNIDFTGGTSTYIDELDGFHDMIPLYAYLRYAVRDAADLPQVNQELSRKVKNLQTYLEQGRNHEGSQYVNWAW